VQSLFKFFGAGKFFEGAPVFGAGFFGSVVGGGGVDAFADELQVQRFRRTDVFALFDLDETGRIFFSFVMPNLNATSFGWRSASELRSPTSYQRLQAPPQGLKPHL